jgi:ribose transport system substrate-binding protein
MAIWYNQAAGRRPVLFFTSFVCSLTLIFATLLGVHSSLASPAPQGIKLIRPNQVPVPKEKGAAKFEQAVPGSGKGLKLGYISLGEEVPFVHLVTLGIQKQAKRAGVKLFVCDSREEPSIALDCAKTFKTEGVQGYLNFQSDATAAPSICAAGPQVPVIAIDIHQQPCERAFMGANNQYAGYIAGLAVGLFMKKNFGCKYDAYVSMEEPAAGLVNDQRMGGYRKGFTKYCPLHNLHKENAFRIDMARTVFTDVLTSLTGRHRIVVVGINDDAIEGALAAAKTAGRVNDLYVAGQGADPSAWCEIVKNPHWIADSAYFPERYGEIGIPNLIRLVKGEHVPKLLLVPHRLVNRFNITKLYPKAKTCK